MVPTTIQYVTGDATEPQGDGLKIIVHIVNDIGAWGAGFVLALSAKWPEVEAQYRAWAMGSLHKSFTLGDVLMVDTEREPGCASNIIVANIVGQRGVAWGGSDKPPIRYQALADGLIQVRHYTDSYNATVHMPRIGAGLAGGNWDRIARIIQEQLCDKGIAVTVYDLP